MFERGGAGLEDGRRKGLVGRSCWEGEVSKYYREKAVVVFEVMLGFETRNGGYSASREAFDSRALGCCRRVDTVLMLDEVVLTLALAGLDDRCRDHPLGRSRTIRH